MSKDLQTLNGQNKLALWAERISESRNSGQNVKAWCREYGVCEQTCYHFRFPGSRVFLKSIHCFSLAKDPSPDYNDSRNP